MSPDDSIVAEQLCYNYMLRPLKAIFYFLRLWNALFEVMNFPQFFKLNNIKWLLKGCDVYSPIQFGANKDTKTKGEIRARKFVESSSGHFTVPSCGELTTL